MKINCIIALIIALFLTSSSCNARKAAMDNANSTTRQITISDKFDEIAVSSIIDLEYTISDKVSLTATAPEAYLKNLKVEVNKGMLSLSMEKGNYKHKVLVKLSAPAATKIIATNNSDVEILSPYNTSALEVVATNNADVTFKHPLEIRKADFLATNNAEISFKSITATDLTLAATNNAEIDAKSLNATKLNATATNNAELSLSGKAAEAALTASNNAEISASALLVDQATCAASNLATITVNATHLNSASNNKGKVKNVH